MRNSLPVNKASNLVPERRRAKDFRWLWRGELWLFIIWKEKGGKQDRKKKVLCRKAIWSTQLLNPMHRSVCYKGWGNDTNKPAETWHSFLEYLLHFSCKYSGHIEDIKKQPLIQILLLGWLFGLSIPEYNPPQATSDLHTVQQNEGLSFMNWVT